MHKIFARLVAVVVAFSNLTVFAEMLPLDRTFKGNEELDVRAFFVGNVSRSYDNSLPYSAKSINFAQYINNSNKTVKSVTGETLWDYKNGIARVDTARSQGATGFLSKRGKIKLSDCIIESKNEHCTIFVIALDDKPIAESEKLLIQSGQEERLYGYVEKDFLDNAGNKINKKEITNVGQYPFNVVKTEATVTLKNLQYPLMTTG